MLLFSADTPYYHCAIPGSNTTSLNDTIPWVHMAVGGNHNNHEHRRGVETNGAQGDSETQHSQCTQYMYDNYSYSNDITTTCQQGYWYDSKSGYHSTIVTEVCIGVLKKVISNDLLYILYCHIYNTIIYELNQVRCYYNRIKSRLEIRD